MIFHKNSCWSLRIDDLWVLDPLPLKIPWKTNHLNQFDLRLEYVFVLCIYHTRLVYHRQSIFWISVHNKRSNIDCISPRLTLLDFLPRSNLMDHLNEIVMRWVYLYHVILAFKNTFRPKAKHNVVLPYLCFKNLKTIYWEWLRVEFLQAMLLCSQQIESRKIEAHVVWGWWTVRAYHHVK